VAYSLNINRDKNDMLKTDLAKIRKLLEKTELELKESIASDDFSDDHRSADDIDRAMEINDRQFRERLRARDILYLKKVKAALGKLEKGFFGICEDCEEKISVKRLLTRPTASLCINCKEEQESLSMKYSHGQQSNSLKFLGIKQR